MEQFANFAVTTLNGSILSGALSLQVTTATAFPTTGNFRILVENEIMLVTAVSGTTFTISRGQEGSLAANHNSGVLVTQIITAGAIGQAKYDAIIIPPTQDANSQFNWKLSDAAGTTTINNAVVGGVAAPLTVNTGTGGNASLGKVGLYSDCAVFNGVSLVSNNPGPIFGSTTVNPVGTPLSVYGWVRLGSHPASTYMWLFGKQYDNGNWTVPNSGALRIYYTNAGDGTWQNVVRPVGGAEFLATVGDPWKIPIARWTLLGFTWDGSNLLSYFNGDLVRTDNAVASNKAIDFTGNGPWGFGGVPHLGTTGPTGDPLLGWLADWWVDGVVRPASYFKSLYKNGIGRPY